MGFINVLDRTISAKLVYYGVGVGGKTTSLQQVHGILCPRNEVQLVSINTEEDQTLLFDFLPINLGTVGGFKVRIQGFTVPGQPKYRKMRQYVLAGADAVVFVVDSQRSRLQENLESWRSLHDYLGSIPGGASLPIVVQYNKRDLPDTMSEAELDAHFATADAVPAFPSVATEGQGVFEAFAEAACRLVGSKVALYGLQGRGAAPQQIAEGVRKKLWELCDAARRERAVVLAQDLPQTLLRVPESRTPEPENAKRTPAPGQGPVLADDEFDLSYDLRESVVAPGDGDERLLDKTVQSNLELAQRFGELDEQRLLLDRKVQELVEVAQNTVHDLNRPVSAVRLMLATLQKGYLGELSAPVAQAVAHGLLAVEQMERLIQDLVVSSRLDHDGMRLSFQPVDMTLLLAEVVRNLRYEIEQRAVHVRIEPLPTIQADAWAMTKAFTNLIGNAIQYGPTDRQPTITVMAADHGREWSFRVQDNGIGIPECDQQRLFRRFERGSNTGGISGTGLGLHIVKEIAQGHGGSVHFESVVGQGTTFVLHVPKQPCQPRHDPLSETAARADR